MAGCGQGSKLPREVSLAPDSSLEFVTLVERRYNKLGRNGFIQTGVVDSVPDPLKLHVRRLVVAAAAGQPSFACQSSEQQPGTPRRPASAHVSAMRAVRRR